MAVLFTVLFHRHNNNDFIRREWGKKSMKKAKRCLIAVVSGVLVAAAVLSGCGQSKKEVSKNDDHLTVYLWENRLMKNIAPYIH